MQAIKSAISEAAVASLPAAKASVCEARSEEHSVLLKGKEVLHSTKAPSAEIASPHGDTILTSPPAKRKALKAKSWFKPKTIQPIGLISSLPESPCWIDW